MFTEAEYRHLASRAVAMARALPIGDTLRAHWLFEARGHITQANNIAFFARLGGK